MCARTFSYGLNTPVRARSLCALVRARLAFQASSAKCVITTPIRFEAASFCRNCLSRWYQEAANERGIEMSKDEGREAFYGVPFGEWKAKYQTEANAETKAKFEAVPKNH
ncbi:uncharacterized protein DUF1244 [Pontivivens insulae]|nr:uncharacterized protein DUF1244 [Pontivivens insulae]